MKFETKGVLEIKGNFFVPDYQRGYRWGENEVKQLLGDIYENGLKSYYLQPIVVKPIKGEDFELIDGQQRLTTLYLLLNYLEKSFSGESKTSRKYEITYETRKETHSYLTDLDPNKKEDNIDFFFIYNAYRTIKEWFKDDRSTINKFLFLFNRVCKK